MSSFGEFGLCGNRRARSLTPFFAAPRMASPSTLAESPCYLRLRALAPWSSPLFAILRLRRWRRGLRLSSLAFIFAVGALVFASLRLPSSSLKSLGRQKTLSLDTNGPQAFGRWPKVASPTGSSFRGQRGSAAGRRLGEGARRRDMFASLESVSGACWPSLEDRTALGCPGGGR